MSENNSQSDGQINSVLESLKKEGVSENDGTEVLYIVYLDDEPDLLDFVSDIAITFGFKSHCTTSVDSALSFIEKHQHEIAYIISDYKMSNMTGFDFREKIIPIAPEIPFNILSANITKEMAIKGIELKISGSGFIDKPITAEKFAKIMVKEGLERIKAIKDDREFLQAFVDEALVNLEQAEELALAFEQNPNDLDTVNKCFGLVHTLKGASGFFNPKTLYRFVHRFEDLLKAIQRGETALNPEIVSSILKSFDFVKVLLNEFKSRVHLHYDLDVIFKEYFELGSSPEKGPSSLTPQEQKSPASPGAGGVVHAKAPDKAVQNELRVSVKLLDDFMQTSGEMTVIRNMINKCVKSIESQFPRNKDVSMLSELLEELHEINATVQSQITNLRKVPVHNILKPIPRLIRDVSKALGKEVELTVVGADLKVDTAIATVLNNSMIHLVRNSLDHGLESRQDREKSGKDGKGKISITSIQKDEVVSVIIEDDGRGINETSIRNRLIKNGTHTEEEANNLDRNELYLMIFESGFSTAEKVTDISGRGVGMSMVKDSVVSLGGRIDIESNPGRGSKFILSLPVPKSVLIRNCLFVVSKGILLGIPQDDVLRVVRTSEENKESVFHLEGALTINHENHLISVVDLADLLEIGPSEKTEHDSNKLNVGVLNLIVIGIGNRKLAVKVDAVLDIEDTVIKPLQGPTSKIQMYQGAAFIGDGTIGLILSPQGILNKAGISVTPTNSKIPSQAKLNGVDAVIPTSDLLLLNIDNCGIYAVPSQAIYRIEEINSADIRMSGGAQIVPYRNRILTILSLSDMLGNFEEVKASTELRQLQTIVIDNHDHFLGLTVESVDEIARVSGDLISPASYQFGLLGNYLLGDRTITLINLPELIDSFSRGSPHHAEEIELAPETQVEFNQDAEAA